MTNNGFKKSVSGSKVVSIEKILITQPRPQSEKSPFFDFEKKHNVKLDFESLISIVPISGKDFRMQKVNIAAFNGVIFTSKHAIDNFFRICEESKIPILQETKYFCITEAIALYLQKFTLFRKRKMFYGADGTNKSMFEVIDKFKENINFLYVCSENQQDSEIVNWLKDRKCNYQLAFMYRTQSADVKKNISYGNYNIVCFFTPSGVKSWFDNFPKFKKSELLIGTFGANTKAAAEKAGLHPTIVAPLPKIPSMVAALDQYFTEIRK
jgi:uroporphyrinogen-III synthase